MGHERLGVLPRRKRWHKIAREIYLAANGSLKMETLTSDTLSEVENRYRRLAKDTGVRAAFGYLVALACADRLDSEDGTLPGVSLADNPSPARIAASLIKWVDAHKGSPEYAALACRAAGDTIAAWTRKNSAQRRLFDDETHASNVWGNVNGSKFCGIARIFFSKLTERYLRYFIERNASASAMSLVARERFDKALSAHMGDVSSHAFETAKITESFSAGWFNKHAIRGSPSDVDLTGFMTVAFGKLQEELYRETNPT